MAVRVRRGREAEDGGGRDGDGDAVRDDRVVDGVALVLVARVLARDRVAHAVAEVDAGVAEPDARQRRGQEHLRLRLEVIRVFHGAGQVLDRAAEGLQREDVGDGVRSLVGGAVDRVRGTGHTLVEGDRGPRFQGVAEHVQTGGGVDGGGHGARVEGVADAEGGLQVAVGDARLGLLGHEIEDGSSSRLGAGAGRGRDRDQRLQWLSDGETLAERGVDEVEEVSLGEDGIEVHELRGVDDGATAWERSEI